MSRAGLGGRIDICGGRGEDSGPLNKKLKKFLAAREERKELRRELDSLSDLMGRESGDFSVFHILFLDSHPLCHFSSSSPPFFFIG